MPNQITDNPPQSQPAQSFANSFISRNRKWICTRCDATIRATDLPHDCRTWRAR